MDAQTTDITIKAFLQQIRGRLEQAAGVAKTAEAWAEAGNIAKAVEIALDIEESIYEANTLLNAASLVNRIGER